MRKPGWNETDIYLIAGRGHSLAAACLALREARRAIDQLNASLARGVALQSRRLEAYRHLAESEG